MHARAELRAAAPLPGAGRASSSGRQGGCHLAWVRDSPPLAFRETPEAVYLVGTAASPVGDDEISLGVVVEAGASLLLRSAASTIAWASTGSSLSIDIMVEAGGFLDWHLQPLVAARGCSFSQRTRVRLEGNARLRWAEEAVLGRSGEEPGTVDLRLDVEVDGRPLLRHQLAAGPGAPGWAGPAVLGKNRAVGFVVVAGADGGPGPRVAGGSGGLGGGVAGLGGGVAGLGGGVAGLGGHVAGLGGGVAGGGEGLGARIAGGDWAVMALDGPGILVQAVAPDFPGLRHALEMSGYGVKSTGVSTSAEVPRAPYRR